MRSMFAVAWGERAVELLDRAAARTGATPDRAGSLAVAGAQGAVDGSWRCWLSGRLTNASELRERFGLPGSTEAPAAIARAYARLGPDACEFLRGTFVVVALDCERQVATVVRDHLGGRPLVHSSVSGGAVFAEHERVILELLPRAPGPDRLALTQWIDRGSKPAERTFFEGIAPIPPAHRAVISTEGLVVEPYWRPRYTGMASGSREEIAERLRASAFAAVERGAEGAQRPAVRLSGGLDSSCVSAGLVARRTQTAPGLALSGIFPAHPETDERELIEATARHCGLPLELIPFDDRASILAPALEHIDRWSLPPATPNLFVWEPLMARARELGVDVMLDGEGGDELFAFAPHLIADRLRKGRALAAWRLTNRIPGIGTDADLRMRMRALRLYGANRLLPAAVLRRRKQRRAVGSPQSLLEAADLSALAELAGDGGGAPLDGPMWWQGLAEDLIRPGETLGVSAHLRREAIDERIDRRQPFLFDLDLLTTVLSHPPELQFEIRDRALMRDALRGRIPESVRTRHEKSYFTGLLPTGLAADGALLAQGPAQGDAPLRGYVRIEALEALLREGPAPSESRAAGRLWRVGLADMWLRALDRPQYTRELRDQASSRASEAAPR